MLDMPYFMENDEWYFFDNKKKKYVIKDNAPQKAKESYAEFYKEIEHGSNQNKRPQTKGKRRNQPKNS